MSSGTPLSIDHVVDEFLRTGAPDDAIESYCHKYPKLLPELCVQLHRAVAHRADIDSIVRRRVPLNIVCPACKRDFVAVDVHEECQCEHCGEKIDFIPKRAIVELVGRSLGGYRIEKKLGEGAFGHVWLGVDESNGEPVAIKVADASRSDESIVRSFLREARATGQLDHPLIASVRKTGMQDDFVFIVSDYVDGVTLAKYFKSGEVGFKEIAGICRDIANALDYAHENGIIHFDIKPTNVMIDREGKAVVLDFGLAREQEAVERLRPIVTQDGDLIGTPEYMSPEQARGRHGQITAATDIFSLGVVLYQLLEKRLPFTGRRAALQNRICNRWPQEFDAAVPQDIASICWKCLSKKPRRRFRSAAALADELQRYIDDKEIQTKPVTRFTRLTHFASQHPLTSTAVVVVPALLLLLTLWTTTKNMQLDLQLADQRMARAESRENMNTPGRRFETLKLVKEAVDIAPNRNQIAVRQLATRALCKFDVKVRKPWDVNSIGFSVSRDFDRFAAIRDSGGIEIRQVDDDILICELATDRFAPTITAFSHSGRYLAAMYCDAHPYSNCKSGFELWDTETETLVPDFPQAIYGEAFCFHPSKDVIGYMSVDGELRIHDLGTQQVRGRQIKEIVSNLAFDRSGNRLAISGESHVLLWNVATGQMQTQPIQLGRAGVGPGPVAWRFDGQAIAVALDDMILTYDLESQALMSILAGHRSKVARLAYANHSDLLASYGWDQKLRLWRSGEVEEIIAADGYPSISFSPDDSQITGLLEKGRPSVHACCASDVADSHSVQNGSVHDFVFVSSRNGSIAVTSSTGGVKFWDVVRNEMIFNLTSDPTGAAEFSPDRSMLVTSHRGEVRFWPIHVDSDGVSRIGAYRTIPIGAERISHLIRFSIDGTRLAITDTDRSVQVFDSKSGIELTRFDVGYDVNTMAISPDGRWMATNSSRNGVGHIWDLNDVDAGPAVDTGGGFPAFSPDGNLLATGGREEMTVWDVGVWRKLYRASRQGGFFGASAFSSDSQRLAWVPQGSHVEIISTRDFRAETRLETLSGREVQSLTFADNDRRLIATSRGSRMYVWNLNRLDAELNRINASIRPKTVRMAKRVGLKESATAVAPRFVLDSSVRFSSGIGQALGADSSGEEGPAWMRAKNLNDQKKWGEARRALVSLSNAGVKRWAVELHLGGVNARTGRLLEAIENYEHVIKDTDAAQARDWHSLAVLYLADDNRIEFERVRSNLIERRECWSDVVDLSNIVRVGTLGNSNGDFASLRDVAEKAGRNDLIGRIQVRTGEHAAALAKLTDDASIPEEHLAAAWLFRAMAAYGLGDKQQAVDLAERARTWVDRCDEPPYWGDRMEAQILLREVDLLTGK